VGEELEDRKHHLTVSVDARFPKEREKEEGESEEDAKKKDEEFEKAQEQLKEKLEGEKKLANRVYLVPNWTVSPLLTVRSEIVQGAEGEKAATDQSGVSVVPSPLMPTPAKPAAAAPAKKPATTGPKKPRATAVTEPVGIDLTGDEPKIIRPEPKSKPGVEKPASGKAEAPKKGEKNSKKAAEAGEKGKAGATGKPAGEKPAGE
jgi:hypothetical protein